jgi:hypothetical protein
VVNTDHPPVLSAALETRQCRTAYKCRVPGKARDDESPTVCTKIRFFEKSFIFLLHDLLEALAGRREHGRIWRLLDFEKKTENLPSVLPANTGARFHPALSRCMFFSRTAILSYYS